MAQLYPAIEQVVVVIKRVDSLVVRITFYSFLEFKSLTNVVKLLSHNKVVVKTFHEGKRSLTLLGYKLA